MHFTRVENLATILDHGLMGRRTLDRRGIPHLINDAGRYDYLPDGISVSISFPNYKMFYSLRQANATTDWVVLRLRPSILWEKQCVFCVRNAADRTVAQVPVTERMTRRALQGMFENHPGRPNRATLGIPANYTTDPQAEVVVLGPIGPEYIIDVIVDARERVRNLATVRAIAQPYQGAVPFFHGKFLFDARRDYAHWRAENNG